jgi:hypothetical protein
LLLLLRLWGATTAVHEAFLQTVRSFAWLVVQTKWLFFSALRGLSYNIDFETVDEN